MQQSIGRISVWSTDGSISVRTFRTLTLQLFDSGSLDRSIPFFPTGGFYDPYNPAVGNDHTANSHPARTSTSPIKLLRATSPILPTCYYLIHRLSSPLAGH